MHCIDSQRRCRHAAAAIGAALLLGGLAGCGGLGGPAPAPRPSPAPAPLPVPAPQPPASGAAVPAPPAAAAVPANVPPRPQGRARNWDEYRLQVAWRLIDANPQRTYLGPVQEPLLAIPVLEVELNGDGSIRRLSVQRVPSQARDTVDLALEAVRRAAPFGDVSHLPRPWRFSEVFLFGDDRRFKPRALDQ